MQTDEEMLERVLQNSGYPGNSLRHDHQQLACSSLVFMIGLPELSLMTPGSEETPSNRELAKIFTDGFVFASSFNIMFVKKSIMYYYLKTVSVVAFWMLCFELPTQSCATCPLFLIFL